MGTSAIISVCDKEGSLATIYSTCDGDLTHTGIGEKLASFLDGRKLVNGIPGGNVGKISNGMGCLAASLVSYLKTEPGRYYLLSKYPTFEKEYEYFIMADSVKVIVSVVVADKHEHCGYKATNEQVFFGDWQQFCDGIRSGEIRGIYRNMLGLEED